MKHRHLFLDLREVTRLERLHRRIHQAEKHPENPLLCCEHPWEDRVSLYGTVIWDPAKKVFRMWYLTGPARDGFVQVRGRRALGKPGSWEDGMARISQCFIVRDEQIYLYYGGVQGAHTGRKFEKVARTHRPELGLATIRRDGFVSVEAGEEEGLLLTKPLAVEGKELHVNADVRGQLIAEVTDGQGIPLPGYTAHPVSKDRTDAVVRFDRPLAALADREARLRFRLREANLYSYSDFLGHEMGIG